MIKLTFKITSTNQKDLENYSNFLIFHLKNHDNIGKIVKIPTRNKKLVLLKSPHVFKKAKEHFIVNKYSSVVIYETLQKSALYYLKLLTMKTQKVSVEIIYKEE